MSESELLVFINATPELASLLYDLDLMPEQLFEGCMAWNRMVNIAEHFKQFEERIKAAP